MRNFLLAITPLLLASGWGDLSPKFIGISEYAIAREVVLFGVGVTIDPAPVTPVAPVKPKPPIVVPPNIVMPEKVCPKCGNKGYTVTPGDEMRVDCNNPDCPVRKKEPVYECPYCSGTGKYIREGKEYSCINPACSVYQSSGLDTLKVYNKNWYYVYKDGVKYRRKRPKGYERVIGKWVGKDLFQVCSGNSCRRITIPGGMVELRLHPEQYGPNAVK